MKMQDLNEMPSDMAALIVRMHHRMQKWRTENPKAVVQIFWRDTNWKAQLGKGKPKDAIIMAPIRTAIMLGLVHVNECGYNMLAAMCEPEALEPLSNTVRQAIELDV